MSSSRTSSLRKRPRNESSDDQQPAAISTPKQKRTPSTPGDDGTSYFTYFLPCQYRIFSEAHGVVEKLVFGDGPYRRKLLDVVQANIDDGKKKGWLKGSENFTAEDMVQLAWQKIKYCWADPEKDKTCFSDESCAYTCMIDVDGGNAPCIAISSSFMENDYHFGQPGKPTTLTTIEDLRTKLFFTTKIKHELCHAMVRFVSISNQPQLKATPEKYTPRKQKSRRRKPVAEIGDHDEEEDTGGSILPLYFNQKLSEANPLCLFFENKYLALNDAQVRGLLQLDYFRNVEEISHTGPFWSTDQCRAYVEGTLDKNFYRGDQVPRINIIANAGSSSSSRASSPARSYGSDDCSGVAIAAWRICTNPIKVPSSVFLWKSSPTDE